MGLRVDRFNDHFFIGLGRVGYPGISLNVFLYNVGGLLIDTGPSCLAGKIKPFLLAFPPEKVVVTHVHEDHCGMAFWINEVYPNVPVYVHKECVEKVLLEERLPLYRRMFWGRRKPFRAESYPETIETGNYSFKVIHVGGHSDDHIVLYEPERGWLFSGDLFITTRPIVMFHEEKACDSLRALKTMVSLDFNDLFCSHSGHHSNGKELLAKKVEYLEELLGKVQSLKTKGYSLSEIDRILFPRKPLIARVSRGEWSSMNLIKSLEPTA